MDISAENKERLLRSRALQTTSTLENYLIRVLLTIKSNTREDDIIEFKGMGLNCKILMIKKLVKLHYQDIYTEVKKALKKYQRACLFRNRMAHCVMSWDDPTLLTFEIWDIEIDKDGVHIIVPIKYTVHEALDELEKLKETCREIIKTTKPIQDEFNQRFPGFWKTGL